ncbi:MAG: hypothetical protein VX265_17075 [Myxococcota bacterium]|nr:hypothetical protein [Myxococcota bacterium]
MPSDFDFVVRGQAQGNREANAIVEALQGWFATEHRALLTASQTAVDGQGAAAARVHLHPIDPGVRMHVAKDGQVTVRAHVFPVGPGFHVFLAKELGALGHAMGIDWTDLPRVGPRDASEHAQERLMMAARAALDLLAEMPAARPALMLPPQERFTHDALVATPLGPRDMHWLAKAATGGHVVRDVFAWPEPGFGARYARGRALSLMWVHLRWRSPRDDAERRMLEAVDRLLLDAWQGEPNQDLPWAEWAEVRRLLGTKDEHTPEIGRRAAGIVSWPPVGYRRRPVSIRLPAGWWITVPGSLATRWEDRATWRAEDGQRSVRVSVISGMERSADPLPQRAMNANQLVHRDDVVQGAAVFERGDGEVRVLRGRMRSGRGEVRIEAQVPRGRERGWAEDIFRSLSWEQPVR